MEKGVIVYERTKSEVVLKDRASFMPFYIVKQEGGTSDIDSIAVQTNERLNGASGMQQITIEEIEGKYGTVQAQAMRMEVLENPNYQPPMRELVTDLTIWTEKFVIQIGTNEMWEWLRATPRNPRDYV